MQSVSKTSSALILPALLITAFVLMGQGCAAPSTTEDTSSMEADGNIQIGDLGTFEAPSDWGTNRSEAFTFRYPPEFTSDLDFETREIVVTDRESGEVIMKVQYFDSEDPVFVDVAGSETFAQMVGSAEKK